MKSNERATIVALSKFNYLKHHNYEKPNSNLHPYHLFFMQC